MREGFVNVKEMDLETKEKLEIMTSTELLDFSWESQTLDHSTLWKLEISIGLINHLVQERDLRYYLISGTCTLTILHFTVVHTVPTLHCIHNKIVKLSPYKHAFL